MHDLAPLTALGASEPRVDEIGSVRIAEVTDVALASLARRRAATDAFDRAARDLIDADLPGPGRSAGGGEWTAHWTGPDQWLLEAPFDAHEDIAREVKAAFGDEASVTEQTDGWARFDLSGDCLPLLERLTPLDTAAMVSGSVSRTVIEHLGCLLICREAPGRWSVLGPRSAAGSLHHALTQGARAL